MSFWIFLGTPLLMEHLCWLLLNGSAILHANVLKNIFYKDSVICSTFIEQYTGYTQATTQLFNVDMPWVIGELFVIKTKI